MKSLRRVPVLCLLVLGGMAIRPTISAADDKDILQLIPADAWGYAYVPSLGGFSENVSAVQNEIMPGMPIPDLLSMAQMQLGIEKGLDSKGAAAVVMMDMKKSYGEAKKAESGEKDKKKKAKDGDDDEDEDKSSDEGSKGPPIVLILDRKSVV